MRPSFVALTKVAALGVLAGCLGDATSTSTCEPACPESFGCVAGRCLLLCNTSQDCGDGTLLCKGGVCTSSICGDGLVEGVEECDNGQVNADSAGCTRSCRLADCGDGLVYAGYEECDDGNQLDTDSCTTTCRVARCGDGVVQAGQEICDDGVNDGSYGSCLVNCQARAEHCGDGAVNGDEVCDDGKNSGSYGSCVVGCTSRAEYCGDGLANGPEACDDGPLNGAFGGCSADCLNRGPQCELPPPAPAPAGVTSVCSPANITMTWIDVDWADASYEWLLVGPGLVDAGVTGDNFLNLPTLSTNAGRAAYSVFVRTVDNAGCRSAWVSRDITLWKPTVAPTGLSGAVSACEGSAVAVSWNDAGFGTYAAQVENVAANQFVPADEVTPASASWTASGTGAFRWHLTHQNGACSASTAIFSFAVATVASATPQPGPAGGLEPYSGMLTWTGTGTAAYTVELAEAPDGWDTPRLRAQDASSPLAFSGLPLGAYLWRVRSNDICNDGWHIGDAFSVSVNPSALPNVSFTSAPTADTVSNEATFGLACDKAGCTFICSLDGATFAGCGAWVTLMDLEEGEHRFVAHAFDAQGNLGPAAEHLWRVDLTAPLAQLVLSPSDPGSLPASFVFGCDEAVCTFECSLDAAGFTPCLSAVDYLSLSNGPHSLWVRASDPAGNQGQAVIHNWTVDTQPPVPSLDAVPASSSGALVVFEFSCGEPNCILECALDAASYDVCTSPHELRALSAGTHDFFVRAVDAAGNVSAPEQHTWDVTPRTWASVSGGNVGSCAIVDEGTPGQGSLWCWGYNGDGQLGLGDAATRNLPRRVGSEADWVAVDRGDQHACGIRTEGSLWCWGHNGSGQLGTGAGSTAQPERVGLDVDWEVVALGGNHTCALKSTGTLWCWGYDGLGQLGLGGIGNQSAPTQVGADTDWSDLLVGSNHACALKTGGTLWCWGSNSNGQLGFSGGSSNVPQQVGAGTNWAALPLSAGSLHTCAVRTDGSLWCWGNNSDFQLGFSGGTSTPLRVGTDTDWAEVALGTVHTCARKTGGTLWCWGSNFRGQVAANLSLRNVSTPAQVGTSSSWSQIGLGNQHSCAIDSAGGLWCWGENSNGALGDAATHTYAPTQVLLSNPTSGEVGGSTGCGTSTDGSLWCWGLRSRVFGTPTALSTPVPIQLSSTGWYGAVMGSEHGCALKAAGSGTTEAWCWGKNTYGQAGSGNTSEIYSPTVVVGGVTDWTQLSAGPLHTCGLRANGSIWCWGYNGNGRLGTGNNFDVSFPLQAGSEADWVSVEAGSDHTCALKADASAWCWGSNMSGQLGTGAGTSYSPVPVYGVNEDWMTISAGNSHTCALKLDNSLWCWGSNSSGQLGDGTTGDKPIPIAVAASLRFLSIGAGVSTHAIAEDGSLWAWGYNGEGALGLGYSGNQNFPLPTRVGADNDWAIVAPGNFSGSCARRIDDSLWCWGRYGQGELGDGNAWRSTPVQLPKL